jgi:hypothetical protein
MLKMFKILTLQTHFNNETKKSFEIALIQIENYFRSNNWNLADCFTVVLSIAAVGLYFARMLMVQNVTKLISATR